MNRELIADDKEENLAYLRTLLHLNGFEVDCCANGRDALAAARRHPPSLVISDLLMPIMDGYALLRSWRADERLAFSMGADAFVLKPAEPELLLRTIQQILLRPASTAASAAEDPDMVDTIQLEQYSRTLIRKLEQKTHELQESNRALRQSQQQYLLLLNSTAEGIYGMDNRGVCTFCNPAAARMLGHADPAAIVGQPVHRHHHHTREDGTPYPLERCVVHQTHLTGAGAHADDEEFIRQDGIRFPVEFWSFPIVDGSEIVGAVVTFLDISERRNLEAQFLQSQKMEAIGRLAGGIAHDFNNALQVIFICSEILADRFKESREHSGLIGEISSAAERSASLTRQLLAFSRRQLLRPVLLNVNSVVSGIQDLVRRIIGEDVALAIFYDSSLRSIKSDVGQIEQVVMNLAVNSRDAMPAGGELIISTANVMLNGSSRLATPHVSPAAGAYVMLSIRDTGTGMDTMTRERIFEPFFTTKEPGKGTGLGLSTVYGILQQSGGFIEVSSAPDRGTTFELYFPATDESVESEFAEPPSPKARRGSGTILLVEDEESLRSLVCSALRASGYTVLTAKDGRSGIDIGTASPRVDLLLTDVIIPDIAGPVVAGHLQSSHGPMKVLYMSGYSADHIRDSGTDTAKHPLLEKPFSIDSLIAKIHEILAA